MQSAIPNVEVTEIYKSCLWKPHSHKESYRSTDSYNTECTVMGGFRE